MRKNRKIAAAVGAVLLILIIMIAAAAIRNGYPLKAVYLEKEDGDGIFVNLTAEYPFTGTIPEGELYDEAGGEITEQDLNSGDVVNIYGNGIMAESYPAQYHGITKIERTEQANQTYIQEYGHYLDELFIEKDPSRLPYLNVCYSDELVSAAVMIPEALSCTWTYEENGESRTITTDAPHILQTEPTEVTKLSEPLKMELQFDENRRASSCFHGTIPFWGNIGTARSRSRRAHLWKCRKMRTEIRNSRHSRDAYIWCRDNGKTVLWIMDSGCRRNKYSAPAKRTITDNELSIKSGEKNIWKQLLYTEAAMERQKYMQRRWQRD